MHMQDPADRLSVRSTRGSLIEAGDFSEVRTTAEGPEVILAHAGLTEFTANDSSSRGEHTPGCQPPWSIGTPDIKLL